MKKRKILFPVLCCALLLSACVQGTREERLPINIEGEPRAAERGEAARQALRSAVENSPDGDRAALREEAIRQILEEFLA